MSGQKITTKFALGQQVWKLSEDRGGNAFELPCRFCRGRGSFTVTGAGESTGIVDCPECRGHRHDGVGGGLGRPATIRFGRVPRWRATGPLTIGSIEVKVTDRERANAEHGNQWVDRDGERYMCWETGVGSGSVYGDSVAIFATQQEAEDEAERKTEAALAGDGWTPSHEELRVATSFLDHRDVYEHEPEHVETAERIIEAFNAAHERR
jgi:hypothetical protein